MSRWRVEQRVKSRQWVVYTTNDYPMKAKYTVGVPTPAFPTWHEALAYADRMSRTVEVTLPRLIGQVRLPAHNGTPGGHPSGYTLTPQDEEHYCAITIRGPWGECGILDPQDIKPLALALLAHAERSAPCACTKQKSHPNHSPSTDSQ